MSICFLNIRNVFFFAANQHITMISEVRLEWFSFDITGKKLHFKIL